MHLSILRSGVLLTLAALGVAAATAQPEFPFAVGVDRTGWAQAQSNAEGRVMIESPEYPRGLWLDLVDEAGQALAGLQVEYQGRPDSLVAIRCIDPAGRRRETLLWTRPSGDPLRLTLRPREPADLPAGLVPIDWQIDPAAEVLLEPVEETRLSGWEAVAAFMQERWQGRTGRVAVQIDSSTAVAVDLDHLEPVEMLVDYLQDQARTSLGGINASTDIHASTVQVLLNARAFKSDLALLEGVTILSTSFILLFEDSKLEKRVLRALSRREGPITVQEAVSLTYLEAISSDIHSLVGLEHFIALQRLILNNNQIADVSPLAPLTNLRVLYLFNNQIADVSPLAALNNLEWLRLSNNQIADVSPLAALNNLEGLRLSRNQIADVSPLAPLTNLEWLDLFYNQIADVSPLVALTNLEWLDLFYNPIADVSPLAPLTNLEWLRLSRNQIADVSPLVALTNLRVLRLSNNQIADVSPLATLTNLRTLVLHANQIEDISPLIANTGLGKGDYVSLSSNPLSDQARTEQIPALKARGVSVVLY